MVAPFKISTGALTSAFSDRKIKSHHRKRSSVGGTNTQSHLPLGHLGLLGRQSLLSPVAGTFDMSLSRSASPALGSGWSSPGLHTSSGRVSPVSGHSATNGHSTANMGGPTSNGGTFFARHMRNLSNSLPRFHPAYAEKDKKDLSGVRGWGPNNFKLVHAIRGILARMSRKLKLRIVFALFALLLITIFCNSPLIHYWRRGPGGGNKFVIILGANVGGGVMEWKGAREWAIERDSIRNKKKYVSQWGYDLEIVDMRTKKKYAHEWRESWEKVDFVRAAMEKYPKAEWFWWLDLTTVVMEPTYSLQEHLFNNLGKHVYRDINEFNPLNISHPFTDPYLTEEDRSAVGDGKPESINLVLAQDCSGFNLGSFFIRRSAWAEQLLDVWWDPVAYEQKHMEWEHKEQDALEQLYISQPWIRKHTAFVPQRMINSFPPAACAENGANERFHYDRNDRDFLVNMAGCEWGRDCWKEMYDYRELSYYLNRNPWERFKEDLVAVLWYKLTGQKVKL